MLRIREMTRLQLLVTCFGFVAALVSHVAGQCDEAPADGFYGDGTQCDRYYHCVNGSLVEDALCPDGLVFNVDRPADRANCELPFGVDCDGREQTRE